VSFSQLSKSVFFLPKYLVDKTIHVIVCDWVQLMQLSQTHLEEIDNLIKIHDEESAKLQQLGELVSIASSDVY